MSRFANADNLASVLSILKGWAENTFQPKLTAGSGVSISNNVISATGGSNGTGYEHYPYGEEITFSSNTPCFGYATSSQKQWTCFIPMPQRLYGVTSYSGTVSYTLRGGAGTQSGTVTSDKYTLTNWGDCLKLEINKGTSFGTNNEAFSGYISGLTFTLTAPS